MSLPHAAHQIVAPDVKLGRNVRIFGFTNCMAARLGMTPRSAPLSRYKREPGLERGCKVSSHTFICEGVTH